MKTLKHFLKIFFLLSSPQVFANEAMKNRIVAPLLHAKLYKPVEICRHAWKLNAKLPVEKRKSLIAIFHKSHLCDFDSRTCINTFRSMSNPCNYFLHNNFHVYHSRTMIVKDDGTPFGKMGRSNGTDEIFETYGSKGPVIWVLDLNSCSFARYKEDEKKSELVTTVMPGYFKKASGEYVVSTQEALPNGQKKMKPIWKHEDPATRFKAMAEALLRFPGVQMRLGYKEASDIADADLYCSEPQLKASFLPFLDAKGQLIKDNVQALRGLLNRQYEKLFGGKLR